MFSLASVWRERSRAAALAACLVVAVPGLSLAQDGDLAARVKNLEAEIANLKVMVSTLTSLVRATPPSALESGPQMTPQDDLKPRLGALEAKNGALANELAQVSGQIERLKAKLDAGMNAPPAAPASQDDLGGRVAALEAQNGALIIQLEKIGKQVNGLDAKLEATPPAPEPTDDLDPRLGKLEAETGALADRFAQVDEQMKSLDAKLEAAPKAAPAAPHDDLKPRLSALETQIGALTNRLEEIGAQVAKLDAKLAVAPQAPAPSAPHAATPEAEPLPPQLSVFTEEEQAPAPEAAPQPDAAPQSVDPRARWYGPKPGEEDDGNPKSIMPPDTTTGALPDDTPQSFAALPDENAEALYKQGYGDYLRQDYAGAEKAFSRLVKAYPNDPLAGSAQYWVGETYYVRKQYQKAADAFLAGYRRYASSDKAPDSLLKLAMSLAALGDEDAACNTFDKLADTFPDAPGDIRGQAKRERKKAGC